MATEKKSYNDFYIDIVIRDFWYCKICNRIYSRVPFSNNNYIFWTLDNDYHQEKLIYNCKEKHNLIEIYALNDKEDCDMVDIIKNNQEIVLPRQVWYCKDCHRVFVRENGEIKVFKVDKIIPYKPKE